MNPKVTVLMPVYNGEKYLKDAIDSILNQTFNDFEFLIINDGSTDKSVEIIESYNDSRIKLINNKVNIGVSASRNECMDIALGEYIAFMDCDDISLPKRLQIQVRFMNKNPEVGICGSWIKVFGDKKLIHKYPTTSEEIKCSMLFYPPFAQPTVMIRKNLFKKYNLYYDKNNNFAEDYKLWTIACKYFPIANINEVLLYYRCHTIQASNCLDDVKYNAHKEIWINQLKELDIENLLTDKDLSIHNGIATRNYKYNEEYLKQCEKWLLHLKKQNYEKNIFNKKVFANILAEKWQIICRDVAKNNLYSFNIYIKSKLNLNLKVNKQNFFRLIQLCFYNVLQFYRAFIA